MVFYDRGNNILCDGGLFLPLEWLKRLFNDLDDMLFKPLFDYEASFWVFAMVGRRIETASHIFWWLIVICLSFLLCIISMKGVFKNSGLGASFFPWARSCIGTFLASNFKFWVSIPQNSKIRSKLQSSIPLMRSPFSYLGRHGHNSTEINMVNQQKSTKVDVNRQESLKNRHLFVMCGRTSSIMDLCGLFTETDSFRQKSMYAGKNRHADQITTHTDWGRLSNSPKNVKVAYGEDLIKWHQSTDVCPSLNWRSHLVALKIICHGKFWL